METLRGGDWKSFYRDERTVKEDEIKDSVRMAWEMLEDDGPRKAINGGGVLSFPHTYLEFSLEAVIRTVKAIYRCGKRKVIALGVLHFGGVDALEKEFSLDCFRDVAALFPEELGLYRLKIDERFLSLRGLTDEGRMSFMEDKIQYGKDLREQVDDDTAIVMTGDLTHYGHGYGAVTGLSEDEIYGGIDEMLDLLYVKKDLSSFLEMGVARKNDQMANGLVLTSLLEGDLQYRIFYERLADYSEVIGARKPTAVASVFYGVWPRREASTDI